MLPNGVMLMWWWVGRGGSTASRWWEGALCQLIIQNADDLLPTEIQACNQPRQAPRGPSTRLSREPTASNLSTALSLPLPPGGR
ncbi:hypothetical protein EDB81DRAFT_784539 [Dactylonectria macrodidyma]|uniref:Secreted protein n=1 Tax=Dactylonectria macrodidyma TaxID=307937 RepID=A0A9P9FGD5_9HYPO|nr:hypothetical protein EDB81DRAFT_784539 [Dactylonectria macrodidyma]